MAFGKGVLLLLLGANRAVAAYTSVAPLGSSAAHRSALVARTCVRLAASDGGVEPSMMRAAQIKAELKERRIDFADCFDKESLVDKLVQARAGLISPTPLPAPPPAPAPAPAPPAPVPVRAPPAPAVDANRASKSPGIQSNFYDTPTSDFKRPYGGAPPPPAPPAPPPAPPAPPAPATGGVDPSMMRAAQIKEELKERRIDFTDCFDKESLADKLVQARAGLISPMPAPAPPTAPAPRGAAKGGFEFGAESRQGENMSMEDAFKAAGWTGEESGKDPNRVDEGRSPGLNRNFGDVSQADFRKPYTGGSGGQRRGRYG